MVHERVTNGEARPDRATNLSLGAAVVATVNAIMAVVVNFGLNLNAQQQSSIQGLVNAIVLLVIAASHVYGQITVERERWSHLDDPRG
jgi:hypothetical protein